MPALEFTLMVGCPLKCTFCPQDALRGAYGDGRKYMPLVTFWQILANVPDYVRIDFSGMAEPWANPEATAMLKTALGLNRSVAIYTTLYGMSRADARDVLRLLTDHARQIEVLCLHLPDANGNMRGWRHSDEYESVLAEFVALGAARVLPRFEVMTMDRSGQIHPALAAMGIRTGAWEGHSRAGNVSQANVPGQPIAATPRHAGAVMCAFTPFYDQNVVLPNGDVVLCCMDYSVKHKIGNLLEQSYREIFEGAALARLRAENMTPGWSAASLCKSCDRAAPLRIGAQKQFWERAA